MGSGYPAWDSPVHWRHRREFSGNNVMAMGIWYEALMRWVGPASTAHAVGHAAVPHRRDGDGFSIAEGDCHDFHADIHPGAAELPNGIDDDFDGDFFLLLGNIDLTAVHC